MVGTAGHIDHGKSSLVRALTGVDPDRLKEEKERGLTIDLGYAPLQLSDGRRLGIVDVPGHEKFVRNMVAGSTALDLAILVVAADDGVMPQTVEHVDILDLLEVERCIVALTKTDLVDEETRLLAADEVRELLSSTRMSAAEILPISNQSGDGLAEFKQKLEALALAVEPRSKDGPFRMSVQRVFQLKGIGTVATGIPVSGQISSGEQVEFLPAGIKSKVRAIQAYGGEVATAVAGHSTALSVPELKPGVIARGAVAASPGIFSSGDALDVRLRVLASAPNLKHRTPVRFHTGTSEQLGLLLVLEEDQLVSGEERVARVVLEGPVCAAYGDPFLLRLVNPVRTVGGGEVLRLLEAPKKYRRRSLADEVKSLVEAGSDPSSRALELVKQAGPGGCSPDEIAAAIAIDNSEAGKLLAEHEALYFHQRGDRAFLPEVVEEGKRQVHDSVGRILRSKPLAASVSRAALRTSRSFPPALKDAVLDALSAEGKIRSEAHGKVLFLDRLRALSPGDQKNLDRLVEVCRSGGFRPPKLAEIGESIGATGAALDSLIARALDEGTVVQVGDHIYSAATIRAAMVQIRNNCLAHDDVLDIPELRDALGTSRKFLIPLLEYVDSLGLTRLRGGSRVLLPSSELSIQLSRAED
jgi:selenocysteine-specific elongation factor